MLDERIYQNYIGILKEEMIPAMGCTEPIALAYGAARAREILGKEPERIVAKCSGNIIKNVRCVIIPNSGGLKGIPAGVILGAVAGDASLNMEVLSKVDEKGRARCRELLEADICKVELLDTPVVLHIIIEMYAGEDTVSLEIKYDHINVTRISKNGEILLDADKAVEEKEETDRGLLNLEDIREFADTVELSDVKELLDALLEDSYQIQERMMLKGCVYRDGRPVKESIALNDIVLTRDGDPRVLKLKLYVDGQFLNEFSADGMIVATPTGSTAYNLSAGGPIAQPDGQLMILTPICPHTLTSRTIVFGADSRIRIEIPATNRGSQVAAFDGDTLVRLENGDYIEITKAETVTRVVKLDHRSFLDILKMKMYDA